MSKILKEAQDILENSIRKKMYVGLSYPVAPSAAMLPHIAEHLRYMALYERDIFLSGPFLSDGALVSEGMTILRTDSEAKAAEFMRNEPFIKLGLRRFELKAWEVREGCISFSTSLLTGRIEVH